MTVTSTLADLAVAYPAAARLFHQHHLDFCCGGRRPLDEACRARGLDPQTLLDEIAASAGPADAAPRWDARPLDELIDHIVGTYHEGLRRDLPTLIALAMKVEHRHGDKPECPRGLADHLAAMQAGILEHLQKEELILFPMIRRGLGARVPGPVHAMEVEHTHQREELLALRRLTADLTPPDSACTTWRALYTGLSELERSLMEHIHLENNVLFPRALAV